MFGKKKVNEKEINSLIQQLMATKRVYYDNYPEGWDEATISSLRYERNSPNLGKEIRDEIEERKRAKAQKKLRKHGAVIVPHLITSIIKGGDSDFLQRAAELLVEQAKIEKDTYEQIKNASLKTQNETTKDIFAGIMDKARPSNKSK